MAASLWPCAPNAPSASLISKRITGRRGSACVPFEGRSVILTTTIHGGRGSMACALRLLLGVAILAGMTMTTQGQPAPPAPPPAPDGPPYSVTCRAVTED